MRRGGFLNIVLIILAVGLLLDWYAFNGLKTLSAGWRSDRWRLGIRWGYLVFSIGLTLLFIAGLGSFRSAKGMMPFHEWVLSLFLALLISKIFFCLILFLGDIVRFFYGVVGGLTHARRESFFPARRRFISEIAVLAGAVPFAG